MYSKLLKANFVTLEILYIHTHIIACIGTYIICYILNFCGLNFLIEFMTFKACRKLYPYTLANYVHMYMASYIYMYVIISCNLYKLHIGLYTILR